MTACSKTDATNLLGYQPESKENLLADSGFKQLSLNTPAKVAAFKKMPPHRISQTTFKGKQVWVYPDQNVCGCLYIGGQTAYNTFLKKGRAQMIDSRVNQMYNQDANDPYNPTADDGAARLGRRLGRFRRVRPVSELACGQRLSARIMIVSGPEARSSGKNALISRPATPAPLSLPGVSTFFTISVSLACVGAGTPM